MELSSIDIIIQLFLLFNNFRALNIISSDPSLYSGFNLEFSDLSIHDMTFFLPLVVFLANFYTIKSTNHPWLINFNTKKLIYLSFCISLFSVFWPKCYCVSWIAYCATHILVNKIYKYLFQKHIARSSYNIHVRTTYKKDLQKIFKI
jgi:hypothetical protein